MKPETTPEQDWQTIIDALTMLKLSDHNIFEKACDAITRIKGKAIKPDTTPRDMTDDELCGHLREIAAMLKAHQAPDSARQVLEAAYRLGSSDE